jgi:serralysin
VDDLKIRQVRACIDRRAVPKPVGERMALVRESLWQSGDVIRAAFLDGDRHLQERVKRVASTWLDYANLNLYFVDIPDDVDIRITFKHHGSWSYIGTDCRTIQAIKPTMNYGWLTPDSPDDEVNRVVLHEFGHALGCVHEHQNPAGGIKWNKNVVYAYYAGPPNCWSKEDVDHNLFEAYDEDLTIHTQLDSASIMMYPIDRRFTLDGFEVGLNTQLSPVDKEFIGATYP